MNFINNFNSFLNESKSVDILEKYLSKIDLSKDALNDIFIDLIDDGFILKTNMGFIDSKGQKTGPLSSERIPVLNIVIDFITSGEDLIQLDVDFFSSLSKSITFLSKMLKQFDMKFKSTISGHSLNIEIRFEKEVDKSIPTLSEFVEKFDSLLFKKFEKFIRDERIDYRGDGFDNININFNSSDIKEFSDIAKNVLIDVVSGYGFTLSKSGAGYWNYYISNSDGVIFKVSESFVHVGVEVNKMNRGIRYRIENYT
jgi:hypothetical protein